jgi:hypothetical protein
VSKIWAGLLPRAQEKVEKKVFNLGSATFQTADIPGPHAWRVADAAAPNASLFKVTKMIS